MDSVFRIVQGEPPTETYILNQWGLMTRAGIDTWTTYIAENGDHYDHDNMRWSGQALMNSVTPLLWKDVERTVGLNAGGPAVFKCILEKFKL